MFGIFMELIPLYKVILSKLKLFSLDLFKKQKKLFNLSIPNSKIPIILLIKLSSIIKIND
jgi:hypothetical protein